MAGLQAQQVWPAGRGELLDNRRMVLHARKVEARHTVHLHPQKAVPRPAPHPPRCQKESPHHEHVPVLAGDVEAGAVFGGVEEEQVCAAQPEQLGDDVKLCHL